MDYACQNLGTRWHKINIQNEHDQHDSVNNITWIRVDSDEEIIGSCDILINKRFKKSLLRLHFFSMRSIYCAHTAPCAHISALTAYALYQRLRWHITAFDWSELMIRGKYNWVRKENKRRYSKYLHSIKHSQNIKRKRHVANRQILNYYNIWKYATQ